MKLTARCVLVSALLVPLLVGCRAKPTQNAPAPPGPGMIPAQGSEIAIFVPCGMTVPFHEAIDLFEAANPNIDVKAKYDNDAALLATVVDEGERPDLFVSPGGRELDVLVDEGLVDDASRITLGSFEIVAVVPRESSATVDGPQDLLEADVGSIALPDPDRSSMGWHVRESLQKLGLWEDVQPKIKPAGRIIEAYEQVLAGSVDLTFTYRSCPLPTDPERLAKAPVRIGFALPQDSYETPMVAVGVLNASGRPDEARQFLGFLQSEQVVAMMVEEGLPDERGLTGASRRAEAVAARLGVDETEGQVFIRAFFPDDERHKDVRKFIAGFEERYPGKVKVSIHDFRDPENDPEGFQAWKRAGFGCAGILVNGKNTVTLGSGDDERLVTFQRKMDVAWKQADLIAAVETELKG